MAAALALHAQRVRGCCREPTTPPPPRRRPVLLVGVGLLPWRAASTSRLGTAQAEETKPCHHGLDGTNTCTFLGVAQASRRRGGAFVGTATERRTGGRPPGYLPISIPSHLGPLWPSLVHAKRPIFFRPQPEAESFVCASSKSAQRNHSTLSIRSQCRAHISRQGLQILGVLEKTIPRQEVE
jgi:hypothetical protein